MASFLSLHLAIPLLRLLNRLAADTACRVGAALGLLAWHLGVRRRRAQRNLTETLGLRGWRRRQVLRRSYATMGAAFLELFTIGGPDGPEKHLRYANPQWQARLHRCHPGSGWVTVQPADCFTRWQRRLLAPALQPHVLPPWS